MEELVIEKVDGSTVRRRYETWQTFTREELERLISSLETNLNMAKELMVEMNK